jgi:adenylate cyclase
VPHLPSPFDPGCRVLIKSYRSAFITLFVLLLVGTVSAVAANAYRRASEVSLALSAETIAQISEKTVQRTVAIFEAALSNLEVNDLIVGGRDILASQEELLRLFWRQLHLTPQLLSIYVADARGSFVQAREQPQLVTRVIDRASDPPREALVYRDREYRPIAHINGGALYDPREEAWYRTAGPDGRPRWSEVYRFSTVGKEGITASRAIPDGAGGVRAVLGVDIALEGLSEFLGDQRIAGDGAALIVDRESRLVAWPYQLRLNPRPAGEPVEPLPRIGDLADTRVAAAVGALLEGRTQRIPDLPGELAVTESGGKRYVAHATGFPGELDGGWRLVIVVPEEALLRAAERLLGESFVLSVIILAVAVFLVYGVAARFFEPVERLARNTERIREFRFDAVEPVVSRFREIQTMDRALAGMQQGLMALSKLMPAELAREMIQSGGEISPSGEVRELTLLCCGISGFAEVCRRLPPERITEVLTDRLELYSRNVLRQRGTLDKYLSDTLMAFWGAPLALSDGPARACRAALQCRRLEDQVNARWNQPGQPPRSLFAVHTGPAIVGIIGTASRISYSAVGENVELTWWLRELNHRYGTRVLVSATARQGVEEEFWWRRVDVLPVEDHLELALYELIDERGLALPAATASFVADYERALDDLLAGDWAQAEAGFLALARANPQEPAVQLMLRRARARSAHPCPGPDGGLTGLFGPPPGLPAG